MVILSKAAKSRYFLPSPLFAFHSSAAQPLLPMVTLNGVSQPISLGCQMLHGFIQIMFRAENSVMLPIWDLSSFQLCSRASLR